MMTKFAAIESNGHHHQYHHKQINIITNRINNTLNHHCNVLKHGGLTLKQNRYQQEQQTIIINMKQ